MLTELFLAGLNALQSYVATHVLTCLVPAFFLAGAMVTFINRELVLDYLGEKANKFKSFPLAAGVSFIVAACSCTVIPVASGLYYAGAGVGVAFILLWVAPSANILSLVYTGNILGSSMVFSRIAAALMMAFFVGTIMSLIFSEEQSTSPAPTSEARGGGIISKQELIVISLLVLTLLLPNYLVTSGPYLHKVLIWGTSTLIVAFYSWKVIPLPRIKMWLRETWWFVKTIFPILLVGVFVVGVIGKVLPEEMIREWLGGNSLSASFFATLLGSVTYFATMTEAPFVDMLMQLGMGKGPALALLLTGPGISLPSWFAIASVFGIRKALVYIPAIIISGTIMGWFFGNFVL